MAHVHVCLVSGQPIPNLTTVAQFRPDTVYLLVTEDMADRAEWLQKAIEDRKIVVHPREVGPYNMQSVIDACEDLQRAHPGDTVSLNITGGTKISTLGAYQSFYTTKWPIYYVNTENHTIMQINGTAEGGDQPIRAAIPLLEYLAVHGFAITESQDDEEGPTERRALTELFVNAACGEATANAIRELNAKAPDPFAKSYNPWMEEPGQRYARKVLEEACRMGLARYDKAKSKYKIPERSAAFYLKGGWLEEHVFLEARKLSDCEVLRNVKGTWTTKRKPPKNEFDVLIGRGNQVFYISCKTSYPGEDDHLGSFREYLYELDALGDGLLGLFGKKMLASALEITDMAIRDRAEWLKVTLVDGQGVRGMENRLRPWMESGTRSH